jgi:hypothetical protein
MQAAALRKAWEARLALAALTAAKACRCPNRRDNNRNNSRNNNRRFGNYRNLRPNRSRSQTRILRMKRRLSRRPNHSGGLTRGTEIQRARLGVYGATSSTTSGW